MALTTAQFCFAAPEFFPLVALQSGLGVRVLDSWRTQSWCVPDMLHPEPGVRRPRLLLDGFEPCGIVAVSSEEPRLKPLWSKTAATLVRSMCGGQECNFLYKSVG